MFPCLQTFDSSCRGAGDNYASEKKELVSDSFELRKRIQELEREIGVREAQIKRMRDDFEQNASARLDREKVDYGCNVLRTTILIL